MIQRTANPPTGPRLGSSSTRSRGGGIQKRRSGPVRVDKDGDLLMDAVDKSKAGKGRLGAPGAPRGPAASRGGRGNARGSLTSQRAQSAILRGLGTDQATVLESRVSKGSDRTTLRVDGLKDSKASTNPDGGLSSLLGFLERKANGLDAKSKRTIKIKKSHKEGDSVIITASAEDAETILKLNNFVFAGSALSIQECNAPSAPQSGKKGEKEELSDAARETQDKIRGILSTRYDVNLKLLNLSALGQDQALRDMGFFDGNNATVAKLFPVLMVVCDRLFTSAAEKREAIVSVSLADNELVSVSLVSSLARTFPDLQNLDLSRNSFPDLYSLQPWRSKFRKLENLVLTGNPMEAQLPDYKNDIMRWYPKLQFLSGIQVRTAQEVVAAAEAARFPIPMKGPDFRDIGGVGEGFIRQFISLYDTDRATLLASFYDNESVFSLSLNTSAPHADRAVTPWTSYTKHSRNLTKITHAPTKLARRYRGVQAIKEVWTSLPATRHPDLATETTKYLVDCHALPGLPDPSGQNPGGVDGLTLTIHSEFEEENKTVPDQTLRSFSRTFILGPGAPGGPQIRVISDVMVLRAWAPLAQPSGSVNPAGDLEAKKQQEEMTAKLMEMTRMTPEYAHLCLNETGWNLEQAFAAFNANKANLPANAFIADGPAAGQMV